MSGVRRVLELGRKTRFRIFPRNVHDMHQRSPGFAKLVGARTLSGKGVEDEQVEEINNELELVFGSQPRSCPHLGGEQLLRSTSQSTPSRQAAADCSELVSPRLQKVFENSFLSHVDAAGRISMVNVVNKAESRRVALATGTVILGSEAFNLVAANSMAKGDVLTVAKVAGIHGAKQTSSLIPLCHNILLTGVEVNLTLDEGLHAVHVRARTTASGPTGVEMEALTAVSIASLTVYDMCKAVSKNIQISNVQLESKTGGKSGDWFKD